MDRHLNLANKHHIIDHILKNLDDPNSSDLEIDDDLEDDTNEDQNDSLPEFQSHLFEDLPDDDVQVSGATFEEENRNSFEDEDTGSKNNTSLGTTVEKYDSVNSENNNEDLLIQEGEYEINDEGVLVPSNNTNEYDHVLVTPSSLRDEPTLSSDYYESIDEILTSIPASSDLDIAQCSSDSGPIPSTSQDVGLSVSERPDINSTCYDKKKEATKHQKPKKANVSRKDKTKITNKKPSRPNLRSDPKKKNKVVYPKWFLKDNDLLNNVPEFRGRMNLNLSEPQAAESPLHFFLNLFPETLIDTIARETTRYASQNGEPEFTTSSDEIKRFLGINIIMTYIHYPNYRLYWSSLASLRMDLIADTMPLKRFEKIKRFLHFVDNDSIPKDNKDIFVKLRPVLDILATTFRDVMTPPEFLAVDEAIIPFKGRSRGKQYLKKKPKKWGFKVWVLAASNGYVSKFELYQGKREEAVSDLGIISDTVLRMCSGIVGLNHKLFLDNLFVSYKLLKRLVENEIHVVGVVRSDRLYGANSVLPNAKEFVKEERGKMNVATSEDNITIVQWKDTGVVYVGSTFAGVEPKDKVERWDKVEKKYIMVDRPHCVAIYNRFMGGVDLSDRMVAHYPHSMKSKRFYLRIFFYFLNVAMVNAWIVLKLKMSSKMSFLEFKAEVANSLIQTSLKRKRVGRPPAVTPPLKKRCRPGVTGDVRFDGEDHYPSKSVPGRCREKNCKSRTRYKCCKCEVPVCPECMENFHERNLT